MCRGWCVLVLSFGGVEMRVVVFGVMGMVGRIFVRFFVGYFWFRVEKLVVFERSVGRKYGELVDDLLEEFRDVEVIFFFEFFRDLDVDIVFNVFLVLILREVEGELV